MVFQFKRIFCISLKTLRSNPNNTCLLLKLFCFCSNCTLALRYVVVCTQTCCCSDFLHWSLGPSSPTLKSLSVVQYSQKILSTLVCTVILCREGDTKRQSLSEAGKECSYSKAELSSLRALHFLKTCFTCFSIVQMI